VNLAVTVGGSTSAPYFLNVVSQDLGLAYAQVGTQIFDVSQNNTAILTATANSQIALVAFGLGSVTPAVASHYLGDAQCHHQWSIRHAGLFGSGQRLDRRVW
jgi:hypothetical protein